MRLKPARENLIVRDPINQTALSHEGEEKPDTAYWRRRIHDGDVVVIGQGHLSLEEDSSEKKQAAPMAIIEEHEKKNTLNPDQGAED